MAFVNLCRRNCAPIVFVWQLWCQHVVDYKAVTCELFPRAFFSNLNSTSDLEDGKYNV